jgi:hypothetical protein
MSKSSMHEPAEDAAPEALEQQPLQDALEGVADEGDAAGAAAQRTNASRIFLESFLNKKKVKKIQSIRQVVTINQRQQKV